MSGVVVPRILAALSLLSDGSFQASPGRVNSYQNVGLSDDIKGA